jgi:hypothetical protein
MNIILFLVQLGLSKIYSSGVEKEETFNLRCSSGNLKKAFKCVIGCCESIFQFN